jgi:threonine/homoserine/homoserine lactone efflux protein
MSEPAAWLLLQGVAIGVAVAAPVGPVGILCMTRTLERGPAIGLATGMGAAVADGLYGAVAALGMGTAARALIEEAFWFRLAGGIFLILLAIRTLDRAFRRRRQAERTTKTEARVGDMGVAFISTVFITISNPATILTFAGIFAATSFAALGDRPGAGAALVAGVFAGSAVWWLFLVGVTARLRHKLAGGVRLAIDVASASAFLVFGAVVLWRAWA